jgi:hypothetical protein
MPGLTVNTWTTKSIAIGKALLASPDAGSGLCRQTSGVRRGSGDMDGEEESGLVLITPMKLSRIASP